MGKIARVMAAAGLALALTHPAMAADEAKLAAEARGIVKVFFGHLKGTLMSAMKEGGPINALDVCKTKAHPIAARAARDSGWRVGRTALKLRNRSNRADAWERGVMKDFIAKAMEGGDLKKME